MTTVDEVYTRFLAAFITVIRWYVEQGCIPLRDKRGTGLVRDWCGDRPPVRYLKLGDRTGGRTEIRASLDETERIVSTTSKILTAAAQQILNSGSIPQGLMTFCQDIPASGIPGEHYYSVANLAIELFVNPNALDPPDPAAVDVEDPDETARKAGFSDAAHVEDCLALQQQFAARLDELVKQHADPAQPGPLSLAVTLAVNLWKQVGEASAQIDDIPILVVNEGCITLLWMAGAPNRFFQLFVKSDGWTNYFMVVGDRHQKFVRNLAINTSLQEVLKYMRRFNPVLNPPK